MEEGYKYNDFSIRGESLIMKVAKFIAILMFVGVLLLVCSCKKNNGNDEVPVQGAGTVDVQMQMQSVQVPSNYIAFDMDIRSVQLHYTDDNNISEQEPDNNAPGWVDLKTYAGIYDLLHFQSNASAIIAREGGINGKKVNGLRLVLGDRHALIIRTDHGDTVSYPMTVSSGDDAGLKVNLSTRVLANRKLTFSIEVDPQYISQEEGVVTTYKLKPVIKLKNVEYQ